MNRALRLIAICISLYPATAVHAAKKPVVQSRTEIAADAVPWTMTMTKGSKLDVKGLNGNIVITRSEDDRATVTMERDLGAGAPKIELLTHSEGFTFCAIAASPNPKKPNECIPGHAGRMNMGVKAEDPGVRFKVSVPEGVEVLARLLNGDISANAGSSSLNLQTHSGNISITDTTGTYVAGTVIGKGDVDASIAPSPDERTVILGNNIGMVRVTIPPKQRVFYAITSEHKVDTPYQLEPAAIPSQWMGELGDGKGKTLRLNLSSGYAGKISLQPRR